MTSPKIDLKHAIEIDASPATVFEQIATHNGLASWWTSDVEGGAKAGEFVEFGFHNHEIVFKMKVDAVEPPRKVTWSCVDGPDEWKGTRLSWELEPHDEGVILRFTHAGWKTFDDYCAMCNSTWGELLHRLRDTAEGLAPGPHFHD